MSSQFHVIKDPVHGTMQFTSFEHAWVKPFIDSPNFQRLRHIKQMGMGDYIFPGAVHTRFNHSLGCCYVASQIANKINLSAPERQLAMIACLLHDIGHGPFSHVFEHLFHDNLMRHEAWTPLFLADFPPSFFENYNQVNDQFPLTEEKFQFIAKMIMHEEVSQKILADIVSSQLDADRLDYLLRDSHFCGVRYGEFDFRWMLHCLCIVKNKDGARLGITHKGIGVVEHYLMARRLMARNIYHAQKKLALESLLIDLLVHLSEHLEHHAAYQDMINTPLGQFLIAANRFNHAVIKNENIENIKQNFLTEQYNNYKELCDYDIFKAIRQLVDKDDSEPAVQIARRLHHRMMPIIFRLDQINLQICHDLLNSFKEENKNKYQDWQLKLITTPHQAYTAYDPILVVNEQNEIHPISDFSITINTLSGKWEHLAFIAIDQVISEDDKIKAFLSHLDTLPKSDWVTNQALDSLSDVL